MKRRFALIAVGVFWVWAAGVSADEYLNGIKWEAPPIITPAEADKAPSDATVLFDGTEESMRNAWVENESWKVVDGAMVVGKKFARTKEEFGDCQLHIEWSAPKMPKNKTGQQRANSGIFFMGKYEIQVLDSYENETYFDGQAGAIYKQTPPQVNAMRPPEEWNVYDILWTAPKFKEDGALESPAYMTAFHNGVVILNHFELQGDTPYNRAAAYKKHAPTGPLTLQDHGNPVRFRNIWVRPIRKAPGVKEREPFLRNAKGEERPYEAK